MMYCAPCGKGGLMEIHAFAVQAQYRFSDHHLYGFEVLARDAGAPEVNSAFSVLNQIKSEDDFFVLDFQALIFAIDFLNLLKELGIKCLVSVNAEISSLRRQKYSNYLKLFNVNGLVIEITERQDIVSNEKFIHDFVKSNNGILFAIDDFSPSVSKVEFLFRNKFFRQVKLADSSLFECGDNHAFFLQVERYCLNCSSKFIIEKAASFFIPPELNNLRNLIVLQGFALHSPVYVGINVTKDSMPSVLRTLEVTKYL